MSVDAFAATTSTLGDRGSHAITGLCESLGIVLTQAALVRARLVLSNNDGLLISVLGGGCAGFSVTFHKIALRDVDHNLHQIIRTGTADTAGTADTTVANLASVAPVSSVASTDCISLVLPRDACHLLKDATIDYIESPAGSYFRLNSPAAKSTCGCGVSLTF